MTENEKKEAIKRVLTAMLEHQHVLINETVPSLCPFNYWLYQNNNINYIDRDVFAHYIHKNRPSIFSSWDAFKNRNSLYFWTRYNAEPRIKWIKKHLKKNS